MTEQYDKNRDIKEAKSLISEFKENLPTSIDPASLTWKSKIPYKVVALREALLYRATELGLSAIELYEKNDRLIPAFILTRAVHETTALFYSFFLKLIKVIHEKAFSDFDDFLMRLLFGWKNDEEFPQAFNILTAIDKLDKEIENLRAHYDRLSEFCHPNYSGVFGAYAKIDHETGIVDYSALHRRLSPVMGLPLLVSSLEIFKHFYNESADLVYDLIRIVEEK